MLTISPGERDKWGQFEFGCRWVGDDEGGIGPLAHAIRYTYTCIYNNIFWRVDRSWLLPVRDEREYESHQGHAATEYDDQREHALLACHRPSVARQVTHDGHPSRVNTLHFGDPSEIFVWYYDKGNWKTRETRNWIK